MSTINFSPFPNLTTERLTLRKLRAEDKHEVFELRSDESVVQFQERPTYKTLEQSVHFIQTINDGIAKNDSILWAITQKNTDKLMGTICLWNISEDKTKAEVGFELLPAYQGKGLMQEAVSAVMTYGFENMKLHSIDAYTNPDNLNAIKLLEKNNFSYVNRITGAVDEVVYTLTR